jgi:cytochrome c biogenesis protein CcmG, thiol:disulfide interchange protein DsbE
MRRLAFALIAPSLLLGCGPGRMPASLGHPLAGAAAPEFHESAIDGREVDVPRSFRTLATVIDFWASWCAGCQESIPALDALYRDERHDGVLVIGVSVDQSRSDAEKLVERLHASFPVIFDPDMQIAGSYGVAQVPITFVVDERGTVRWVGRSPSEARRAVHVVLAE